MGTRLIRLLAPRPNRMRRVRNNIIAGIISIIKNTSIDVNVDWGVTLNTCVVIKMYAIATAKLRW